METRGSIFCIIFVALSLLRTSPLFACDNQSNVSPTDAQNQHVEQILRTYSALGIHDLAGFNVLTFATKKSALWAILASGKISPVSKLSGVAPTNEISNQDVVYTMLQPRWLVNPEENQNKYDVSKQVIFCLPTQLMVARTDWYMNSDWHYGIYYGDTAAISSAHPANMASLEKVISQKFNALKKMIDNATLKEKKPWLNDANFQRIITLEIQNEVLFKSDIDLTSLDFVICFCSCDHVADFLVNNKSLSPFWDFEQQNNCLKVKAKTPLKYNSSQ